MTDIVDRLREPVDFAGCDPLMLEAATEIERLRTGVAQQPPSAFLWCCHVRGPDDVYAAPDYETALAWSDILNEMNWRSGAYPKPLGFQNPASYADCLVKATPAPWPYSAEAHAEDLPKSIAGFAPPSSQGASK